jgi:hypothetical protein
MSLLFFSLTVSTIHECFAPEIIPSCESWTLRLRTVPERVCWIVAGFGGYRAGLLDSCGLWRLSTAFVRCYLERTKSEAYILVSRVVISSGQKTLNCRVLNSIYMCFCRMCIGPAFLDMQPLWMVVHFLRFAHLISAQLSSAQLSSSQLSSSQLGSARLSSAQLISASLISSQCLSSSLIPSQCPFPSCTLVEAYPLSTEPPTHRSRDHRKARAAIHDHVMAGDDQFFDDVERWRKLFETNPLYAARDLATKFAPWYDSISEDDASLKERPSSTRSIRSKRRRTLRGVSDGLGADVLLLCTLATTATRLHQLDEERLVPRLREWWRTVEHPAALKEATAVLGKSFPWTLPKDTGEDSFTTKEGEKAFPTNQSEDTSISQGDKAPSTDQVEDTFSIRQDDTSFSTNQGEVRVTRLDFKLHDLLEFLAEKNTGNQDISYSFQCPWNGNPQFAEMDQGAFEEAGFKVELSLELGSQWCDYIYEKRRMEGVP